MFKLKGIKPKRKYQFGGTVDLSQSPSNYYYMGESVMPVMPIQPFNPQTDDESTTPKAKSDKGEGLDLGDDKDLKDIKGLNKETEIVWSAYQGLKSKIQQNYKEWGNTYMNKDFAKDMFELNRLRGIMKNSLSNNLELVNKNQEQLNKANAQFVVSKGKILVQNPNTIEGVQEMPIDEWFAMNPKEQPEAVKASLYSSQMHQGASSIEQIIQGTDVSKRYEINQQSIKDVTDYINSIGANISTGDRTTINSLSGNAGNVLAEFIQNTSTKTGNNWEQYNNAVDAISLSQAQVNGLTDNFVSRLLNDNQVSFAISRNGEPDRFSKQVTFTRDQDTNKIYRIETIDGEVSEPKETSLPNYLKETRQLYIQQTLNPNRVYEYERKSSVEKNPVFNAGGGGNKERFNITEMQKAFADAKLLKKIEVKDNGAIVHQYSKLVAPDYMSVTKSGVLIPGNDKGLNQFESQFNLSYEKPLKKSEDLDINIKEGHVFTYVKETENPLVGVNYYITTKDGQDLSLAEYLRKSDVPNPVGAFNDITTNFDILSNKNETPKRRKQAKDNLELFRKKMGEIGFDLSEDILSPYLRKAHFIKAPNSIIALPTNKVEDLSKSQMDQIYGLKPAEDIDWAQSLITKTIATDKDGLYNNFTFFVGDVESNPIYPGDIHFDKNFTQKTEEINDAVELFYRESNNYQDGGQVEFGTQTSAINTDEALENMPLYIKNNMAAYFGKNIDLFI